MAGERSPKKRRTDSNTVSAKAIAQANSTLQVFLGQQQNRWMQGHTPSSTENSRESAASSGVNVVDDNSRNIISDAPANHPSTSNASLDNMARTAAHPGLPSPPASDETGVSPIILMQEANNQIGNQTQPSLKKKAKCPRRTDQGQLDAVQTGPQAPIGHQQGPPGQRSQAPSTSMRNVNRFIHTQMPSQLPSATQRRRQPIGPLQPLVPAPQPQRQAQDSMFSQKAMLQRYQHFHTHEVPKHQLNGVDIGRIRLLKDAIERFDIFYLVLSQIHVLAETPHLIPFAAQGLDPRSYRYLDCLICSAKLLNPAVREWLANFPAPILQIYSSTAGAGIYEPMVKEVTEFLQLLPQLWDGITTESKSRGAPPLVEDLHNILHLPSAVFQTTAFRAIARLVLDQNKFISPEKGIDKLGVLHKLDQLWFAQNGRRHRKEKSLAYRAFRITTEAWKAQEPKIMNHERQQTLGGQSENPLHFMYPPDAFAAFQPRVGNSIPPVLPPAMHYQTAAQQQQVLLATNRALLQNSLCSLHPSITPEIQQQAAGAQHQNGATMPQRSFTVTGLVFPREGEMPRPQPTNPDPIRSALHQAHLRSPTLGSLEAQGRSPRLYRYVTGFALSPEKIDKDMPVQTFTFHVSQQGLEKIPATVPSERAGEPPTRVLSEDSETYRLRCAFYPDIGFPSESTWIVADNYWPENLFLEFNDRILEPCRKLHHNRYLPIDLTHLIRPGQNSIKAIVNRVSTDPREFEYVLAVEIVGVMNHKSIRTKVRTISAAKTLQEIKTLLCSGQNDDDLAVTSSNLPIRLFDPYSSSKIFDIPVRGSACRHNDCFDLEIFLNLCKREKPGWPTVVDCWRCPLCRGDVRPQTLVIDEFLVEVRKELEKRDLLDTRAIIVEADGSWKPKEEEVTGVRSPSLDHEERSISESNSKASASKKVREIIEID